MSSGMIDGSRDCAAEHPNREDGTREERGLRAQALRVQGLERRRACSSSSLVRALLPLLAPALRSESPSSNASACSGEANARAGFSIECSVSVPFVPCRVRALASVVACGWERAANLADGGKREGFELADAAAEAMEAQLRVVRLEREPDVLPRHRDTSEGETAPPAAKAV